MMDSVSRRELQLQSESLKSFQQYPQTSIDDVLSQFFATDILFTKQCCAIVLVQQTSELLH